VGSGAVSAQERQIPGDSPEDEPQIVRLSRAAVAAIEQAKDALEADLAFEDMTTAEADLWSFAGRCIADTSTDPPGEFIRRYAKEIAKTICRFGVEFLAVEAARQIGEVWLLPLDDPDVARASPVLVGATATVGCVAAVPVSGTSPARMAARREVVVRRVLQVLRVSTVRGEPGRKCRSGAKMPDRS
jgi:hypothetical protein